jgi:hypothetical protein
MEGSMGMYVKRMIRIWLLLILAVVAAEFIGGRPAFADRSTANDRGVAQQSPQRPAQKPAPAAKVGSEASSTAPAEGGQAQSDEDVQKQLLNAMREQFEKEALDRIRYGRAPNVTALDRFMDAFLPFLVFLGVLGATFWILRTVLENRRWNKMVKVQTETHAKLLERFGSSQEMLAYMQSEAGKKFLEAPIFEGQRRQVSTLPFGRILWSVQVGIISAFLGAGLLFLRGRVSTDADMGFEVFGTLVLTLGIGFLVSGGVSYVLAKYFGLLERQDAVVRPEHSR